jgi:hypothetical protein
VPPLVPKPALRSASVPPLLPPKPALRCKASSPPPSEDTPQLKQRNSSASTVRYPSEDDRIPVLKPGRSRSRSRPRVTETPQLARKVKFTLPLRDEEDAVPQFVPRRLSSQQACASDWKRGRMQRPKGRVVNCLSWAGPSRGTTQICIANKQ